MQRKVFEIREPAFGYSRVSVAAPLAAVMRHVWTIWARRCRTSVEAALPDTCAELYFNLGSIGRHVVFADAAKASTSPRAAWVVGPREGIVLVAKEIEDSHIVGVRLLPDMIPYVLGVPAIELRDGVVDLEHFWKGDVERVRDSLHETVDPIQRTRLLEDEVLRRLASASWMAYSPFRTLRGAIEGGSDVSVGGIARRFGLTHRRVIALFGRHVGLRPKEYQRVHRFRTVLSRLGAPGRHTLARLAHEAGYCDQAHLSNDFRRLAGVTVTHYLAVKSSVGEGFYPHRLASSG